MTYIIVYVTTKDAEEASRIGEALVKERLAACANVIPSINSVYWWKGRLERDSEAVLLLKSTRDNAEGIIERVRELHSYGVPCIDVISLSGGNQEYFKWLEGTLGKGGR